MSYPKRSVATPIFSLSWLLIVLLLSSCTQRTPTEASTPQVVRVSEPPLVSSQIVQPVQLRDGHPQRYVVQPGDTLWGLASRFLQSPWRWQEIWQRNPNITNPDRIYPGDILELYYDGSNPRLRLTRGTTTQETPVATTAGGRPIIKLSPQIRVEAISQPIPTVPRDSIRSFLSKSRVVSSRDWEGRPYIIAGETPRINLFTGDRVYVRGGGYLDRPLYHIFRPGEMYQDPQTGENLGFQLEYLGDASLEEANADPAILRLLNTTSGVKVGDRLFEPDNEDVVFEFSPRPAPPDISGRVIKPLGGGFLLGKDETAVISVGSIDGIEPGHVLVTEVGGQTVSDPVTGEPVLLPGERSGVVMIYEVFDRVSYGLVMEAGRTIRVGDQVGSPL